MNISDRERPEHPQLDGWDQKRERVNPLPGQARLFDYRPRVTEDGQCELFDTGRDLPGAPESDQQLFWDVES